jgi:signal transduction histidine kinase/CheY-like chemotaxis protein/HPt (histidine-containing phosphotransfer) domain-containing protein
MAVVILESPAPMRDERPSGISLWLVLVACLPPLVALAGWTLDVVRLETGGPADATRMNPMSAVALLAIAAAWFLISRFRFLTAARLILLFPLAVSALRVVEYMAGRNSGFDFAFFHDRILAQSHPNHIAPNTAIMLLGLAAALFVAHRSRRADEVAAWLVIAVGTLPFFATVGYASQLGSLYSVKLLTPMALNSAVSGLLLGIASLLRLRHTRPMAPFASPGSGGLMARRVFPLALGVPVLLGLLLSESVNRSLLDRTSAVAFFVISVVTIIAAVIHRTAGTLDEFDAGRVRQSQVIQDQNDRLNAAIAELRRNEELLRQAKRTADEANAAKSAFLARMSHEIRTPMNAICGVSDLLWDTSLAEEQREYVRIFRRNSERLLNLINDILDLSKVEAGAIDLDDAAFDLNEVLERVTELVAPLAHQKGLELLCEVEPGAVTSLMGDADRLQQILLNLLGNAIKFTTHGEVSVKVSQDPGCAEPGALLFTVRDTGSGIEPEHLASIFDPFVQVDTSMTRRHQGTGLGLAIIRKLAELMGGRVLVESWLGKGSAFHVTVRLRPAEGVPRKVASLTPLPEARALVVDDSETNRMLVRRHLLSWGMESDEAGSGADALEKLAIARGEGREFRLVILDCLMPGADGFDVAESILGASPQNGPAIVMLTSDYRKGDLARAQALGISTTLTKPVRAARLHEALQNALSSERDAPGEVKEVAVVQPPRRKAARILVADDFEDNRFLIKAYLAEEPWTLDFAEDGAFALRKALSATYDLILMDVQMPAIDGYEVTRQIRLYEKSRNRAAVPIVALTAHALASEAVRSREAGCSSYLAKPISKADLLAEIDRWLSASPTPRPEPAVAEDPLPEMLRAMIPEFIGRREQDLVTIREHIGSGNFQAIRALAHNIKGSGSSFGFPEITDAARRMESAAQESNAEEIESLVAVIALALRRAEP